MALESQDITNITNAVNTSMDSKFDRVYTKIDEIQGSVEAKVDEMKVSHYNCREDMLGRVSELKTKQSANIGRIDTVEKHQKSWSVKAYDFVKIGVVAAIGYFFGRT